MMPTLSYLLKLFVTAVLLLQSGCAGNSTNAPADPAIATSVKPPDSAPASVAGSPAVAMPTASNRRIVGGISATIGRHPWQVALNVRYGSGLGFCGGSLVAPRWVVTAAHCLPPAIKPGDVSVKAGVTDYAREGEWISVERIVRHEGYDQRSNDNDIALLKIASSTTGRPIPLASETEPLTNGQLLEVTGWGATSDGGAATTRLQKVAVPFVTNDTCNKSGSYNSTITPRMICAGSRSGGVDACQGDSGGPLVNRQGSGPVLVGVVSFGEGCARKLKYGVYTRVSQFRTWIDRIVGAEPI